MVNQITQHFLVVLLLVHWNQGQGRKLTVDKDMDETEVCDRTESPMLVDDTLNENKQDSADEISSDTPTQEQTLKTVTEDNEQTESDIKIEQPDNLEGVASSSATKDCSEGVIVESKEDTAEVKVEDKAEVKNEVENSNIGLNMGNIFNKEKTPEFPTNLEKFGYAFKDGKLSNIKTGEPFKFNVKPGNHRYNQLHYEALGKVIDEHVYKLLEEEGKLKKVFIPEQVEDDEPQGFFFMSDDVAEKENMLVLIHGSGVVRAGQWARRLIINDNLDCGTQLPYIKEGRKEGYSVVVMNTNQNYIDDRSKKIQGSESPEAHGLHVWDNYIEPSAAKNIAVVAHSYGGVVALNMAIARETSFVEKVFAVAFTDSVHSFGYQQTSKTLKDFFKKCCINWVTSSEKVNTPIKGWDGSVETLRSAGVDKHEWTSWGSFKSVFEYFRESLQERTNANVMEKPKTTSDDAEAKVDETVDKTSSDSQETLANKPSDEPVDETVNKTSSDSQETLANKPSDEPDEKKPKSGLKSEL